MRSHKNRWESHEHPMKYHVDFTFYDQSIAKAQWNSMDVSSPSREHSMKIS